MNSDYILLGIAWAVTIVLLIFTIPKGMLRQAIVIFLFKQFLTWILGLVVVQYGLIEYPVRLFSKASGTSFTFEYFIYPAFCVIFNMHYPVGKSKARGFMHYVYFCSAITIVEFFVERYTNIINYIHWTWYLTWISLFITFYISRKFYLWFYKSKENG